MGSGHMSEVEAGDTVPVSITFIQLVGTNHSCTSLMDRCGVGMTD